jgi:DNA-binding NarL/FixJ family response regulator
MPKIFIVDDHPVIRQNYILLIRRESNLEICGEASSGLEALAQIHQLNPDIVVLDVSLTGEMDGVELLKQLLAWRSDLAVLMVSGHDESIYAERVLQLGARGYVAKGDALLFLQALRQVANGGIYKSAQLSNQQD